MTSDGTVTVERTLGHPVERVWRALTQQWLLAEWLMPNDFVAETGHRFTLKTEPMPHWNGVVECELLEIDPMSRLSYSWNTETPGGTPGLRTVVTFTLAETNGGTLLRVEQSGFRADQPENRRGAEFGWQRNLERLGMLLEGKS